jgi:hypothetical protein
MEQARLFDWHVGVGLAVVDEQGRADRLDACW